MAHTFLTLANSPLQILVGLQDQEVSQESTFLKLPPPPPPPPPTSAPQAAKGPAAGQSKAFSTISTKAKPTAEVTFVALLQQIPSANQVQRDLQKAHPRHAHVFTEKAPCGSSSAAGRERAHTRPEPSRTTASRPQRRRGRPAARSSDAQPPVPARDSARPQHAACGDEKSPHGARHRSDSDDSARTQTAGLQADTRRRQGGPANSAKAPEGGGSSRLGFGPGRWLRAWRRPGPTPLRHARRRAKPGKR